VAFVDASGISQFIREKFGVRLEASSGAYLHQKLTEQPGAAVPIMGGDARTGIAVRKIISLNEVQGNTTER
jgi:hypothetical protein